YPTRSGPSTAMPVRPPRRRTMPSSPRSAPTTPPHCRAESWEPRAGNWGQQERGLDATAFVVGLPNCNGMARLRMRDQRLAQTRIFNHNAVRYSVEVVYAPQIRTYCANK